MPRRTGPLVRQTKEGNTVRGSDPSVEVKVGSSTETVNLMVKPTKDLSEDELLEGPSAQICVKDDFMVWAALVFTNLFFFLLHKKWT